MTRFKPTAKIDGKIYKAFLGYEHRNLAESSAEKVRRDGAYARVLKKGNSYVVFFRNK